MKIQFRQGILRYQTDSSGTPEYLIRAANDVRYIDLAVEPDPCVITFAHGRANYTIEEVHTVENAWGPFETRNQTVYLYWDIDVLSGVLSRRYTAINPVVGPSAPSNPITDQHWFDLSAIQMKVWNGVSWVIKIRVFAGAYDGSANIINQQIGSQVGLNTKGVSGSILFDDRLKPIRADDNTFLTSETNFHVKVHSNHPNSELRFESLLTYVKASEYIPAFSCVSFAAHGEVKLGRYTDTSILLSGIVIEDMFIGDVSRIITSGVVYNEQWNWTASQIGKPFFCGPTGEITLNPPPSGVVQMVGTIDSQKTINVSVQAPIYFFKKG